GPATRGNEDAALHDGTVAIVAPMQGSIVSVAVREGDPVQVGQPVLVMEAMKMEHLVEATVAGVVQSVLIDVGDAVFEGSPLVLVEEGDVTVTAPLASQDADLDSIRADLDEVLLRQAATQDAD